MNTLLRVLIAPICMVVAAFAALQWFMFVAIRIGDAVAGSIGLTILFFVLTVALHWILLRFLLALGALVEARTIDPTEEKAK